VVKVQLGVKVVKVKLKLVVMVKELMVEHWIKMVKLVVVVTLS